MKGRHQDSKHSHLMYQYSRCKGIGDKDHNSKYFHALESLNKKQNLIDRISINGNVVSEVEDVIKGITKYFEEMYRDEDNLEIEVPYGVFKQFSP